MSMDPPSGGLPKGLGDLLNQAKKMQERLNDVQARLAAQTATGEAGGGMVRVTINGRHEVKRIEIEPTVIDPAEREMLQDLLVAATNQAIKNIQRLIADEMSKVTGGLNVPGLF